MGLELWVRIVVFKATFNSNSVISWRSVLLVEETNRSTWWKPPACKKSLTNLSHNVVSSTPCHERDSNSQSTECKSHYNVVLLKRNYKRKKITNYIFWLEESQRKLLIWLVKIKYFKFPTGRAAAILTKIVMSLLLFSFIQASVTNTAHIINHSRKISFTAF